MDQLLLYPLTTMAMSGVALRLLPTSPVSRSLQVLIQCVAGLVRDLFRGSLASQEGAGGKLLPHVVTLPFTLTMMVMLCPAALKVPVLISTLLTSSALCTMQALLYYVMSWVVAKAKERFPSVRPWMSGYPLQQAREQINALEAELAEAKDPEHLCGEVEALLAQIDDELAEQEGAVSEESEESTDEAKGKLEELKAQIDGALDQITEQDREWGRLKTSCDALQMRVVALKVQIVGSELQAGVTKWREDQEHCYSVDVDFMGLAALKESARVAFPNEVSAIQTALTSLREHEVNFEKQLQALILSLTEGDDNDVETKVKKACSQLESSLENRGEERDQDFKAAINSLDDLYNKIDEQYKDRDLAPVHAAKTEINAAKYALTTSNTSLLKGEKTFSETVKNAFGRLSGLF